MFKFIICTVIIIIITSVNVYCSYTKCIQETPCLCVKDDYSKLDISSILGNSSQLEDTSGNITYYFLGCKDKDVTNVNCTTKPNQSSLIKYNKTDGNCISIGKASSIKFEFANDKHEDYQIVYNESGNVSTYPTIRLICVDLEIPFIKSINENSNELVLGSPKACFTEARLSPSLSGGSIFLLILFITAGVYFFGGALLLYCIRGARGMEVIPNLDFWKNLPGLVKDGAIFVLSGCKPTFVSTAETYDRI